MATVTSYTAARMKQIEDAAIVSGHVAGDNLMLTPKGFPTIPEVNAGNVRGPKGDQGPQGNVSLAQLNALVPPGTMSMFAGDAAPAGYLLCDGAAVDRATYAALFAVLGTKYGAGNGTTTFNLPDMRSRMPAGKGPDTWSDTVGKKGGYKDSAIISHSHLGPTHSHSTPNHQHSIAAHYHDMSHNHDSVWSGDQDQSHQHLANFNTGAADRSLVHTHNGNMPNVYFHINKLLGLSLGKNSSTGNAQDTESFPSTSIITGGPNESIDHLHSINGWVGNANQGHKHSVAVGTRSQNTGTGGSQLTPGTEGGSSTGADGNMATETVGVAAADRNLNPYVIVNFIVKV